ncbi:hypothetical protein RDWZM_010152 [Blomia tropicalis]|uniref:TRAPPC10/Trs130 N-terminal domain-containing protein n=1 Tax=Blomia tropicalis TaxID=40697 RepID=A0A9Q0M0F2_BLOTA|nr:hypothetical protein RDWZM_010152 [Blomia tropicalis]
MTTNKDSNNVGSMLATNLNPIRNVNENPIITVSGDLSEFVLSNQRTQQSLSSRIVADFGRESIDWHRSYHDNPVPVYLDTNLVALDERIHLHNEQFLQSLSSKRSNRLTTTAISNSSASGTNNILATSSVKRNHSFNVIRRSNNQTSNSGQQPHSSSSLISNNNHNQPNEFTNISISGNTHSTNIENNNNNSNILHKETFEEQQINQQAIRSLAQRYNRSNQLGTSGSAILLHSYWIDASARDLESYHQTIREPLLDWFSRILIDAASNCRLGLSTDFQLNCTIVAVIGKRPNRGVDPQSTNLGSSPGISSKNSEQVLSLERLIADTSNASINNNGNHSSRPGTPTRSIGTFSSPLKQSSLSVFKQTFTGGGGSGNKFRSNKSSNQQQQQQQNSLNSALSSSLTSLNSGSSSPDASKNQANHHYQTNNHNSSLYSASSTNQLIITAPIPPLTIAQLLEQIRNDLSVAFQLFQQKQFTSGNFDSGIPPNVSTIVSMLHDSMIVFDYGTIDNESSITKTSNNNVTKASSFSIGGSGSNSGSVRIMTPSMMMMSSPAKVKGGHHHHHSPLTNSNSLSSTSNMDFTTLPINSYQQLIQRLRSMSLESYTRILDALERLIRRQRELRANVSDWDFFAFFILQEEAAFIYETLGLYNRSLIQYDELDALFSQSILNANAAGSFGRPAWLQRRLIDPNDDYDYEDFIDDTDLDELNNHHHHRNSRNSIEYGMKRTPKRQRYRSSTNSSLYSSWNGLCLCNPESINQLRCKIIQCTLHSPNSMEFDHSNDPFVDESTESMIGSSGPQSIMTDESKDLFADPLGVMGTNNTNYGARFSSTSSAPSSTYGLISLIDFRNYLFARQCHLLCLLNKPWELASRALPFLQTCVTELKLLEISIAPGGIACWVFTSVLEILHKCERYSDSSQLESYSYHTVGLWSYARDMLAELGTLCNLMPGSIDMKLNSSAHLHRMVELIAGMGADPHLNTSDGGSAQERLKDALSSSESFLKNYLEVTELTMGTYKHIGHIRSARLIGKELSELYLKLNKPQQALPFLLDLYNLFQAEQWPMLRIDASKLLAQCLEALYFSAYSNDDNNNNDNDCSENENDNESDESTFNLEATCRSAFRTYLQLLIDCTIDQRYIDAIHRLLDHYESNGLNLIEIAEKLNYSNMIDDYVRNRFRLELPMLVVHNIYSDLFYDPCSTYTSNGSLNRSTTNMIENLNPSSMNHSSPTPTPTPQIHCMGNYSINEHFLRIESIDIQALAVTPNGVHHQQMISSSSTSDRSFIAGSRLGMRLSLWSTLSVELTIDDLMVTIDTSNEMLFQTTERKRSTASMSSNGATAGSLSNHTSSSENIDCDPPNQHHHHHRHCECEQQVDYQNIHMESFYGINGAGTICRNANQLLNRQTSTSNSRLHLTNGNNQHLNQNYFDTPSKLKLLPQLPVSLLNQRLSDDQNNFRHYRFISAKCRFELERKSQSNVINLSPGLNEFELFFDSPHQFNHLQANQLTSTSANTITSNRQINQQWFQLDQLVIQCHFRSSSISSTKTFAIVDDFPKCSVMSSSTNFRLVKCLPTVELIPITESVDDNSCETKTQQQQLNNITSLLIGNDQLVQLRLNSGTDYLPKGLKCFIRIAPVNSMGNSHSSNEHHHYPTMDPLVNGFDYRLVQVNLYPHTISKNQTGIANKKDESILYFYLDRQIDPFETYEIMLRLRSSFARAQNGLINQWTMANPSTISGLNGTSATINSMSIKPPIGSNSREFSLIVSWTQLDQSSQLSVATNTTSTISAGCHFTIHQPYHLYTKMHTCGRRKLLEVTIRGANELERSNCNAICIVSRPKINTFISSIQFRPMTNADNEQQQKVLIKANCEHHFVWSLEQTNNKANNNTNLLKRFNLSLQYDCESLSSTSSLTNEVNYDIRLSSSYSTKYIIRESIEPLPCFGMGTSSIGLLSYNSRSSSELVRVGSSCLLRIIIEHVKNDEIESNDSNEDEELIMYELVYDSDLWSLVQSYRSSTFVQQSSESSLPSINSSSIGYESLNMINNNSNNVPSQSTIIGGSMISNDCGYQSIGDGTIGSNSGPESIRSTASSTTIDFNIPAKVIRLNGQSDPTYEAYFEMMPLVDGSIPFPLIRLSRYVPIVSKQQQNGNDSNSSPTITTTTATTTTSKQSTMIESLSAKLSENLSLSKTSWTSKLLPKNSSTSSKNQQQQQQLNDQQTLKSTPGRLVAFEPGQVYNYNRTSQIYVLPQLNMVAPLSSLDSSVVVNTATNTFIATNSSANSGHSSQMIDSVTAASSSSLNVNTNDNALNQSSSSSSIITSS